jgi:class 3 adenylate cyclase
VQSADSHFVHVLFLDVVGYGLLSNEGQAQVMSELRDVVYESPLFKRSVDAGEVKAFPRGDGMIAVWDRLALGPLRSALEIAQSMVSRSFDIRMGIHSGIVDDCVELDLHEGYAGNTIVLANRIMTFAEGGQILVSRTAAESAMAYEEFGPKLHDVGELNDKHGLPVRVFNYFDGTLGKPWSVRSSQEPQAQPSCSEHPDSLDDGWAAMSFESPFYVQREADKRLRDAIREGFPTLHVQGFHQMGKTSLLARAIYEAKRDGFLCAYTDVKGFGTDVLESPEQFYFSLTRSLAYQLEPDRDPSSEWSRMGGAAVKLEGYIRSVISRFPGRMLLWAIDEPDALFASAFRSEVFGLFRSWFNRRATEPDGPLSRLIVAFSYSTDPILLVRDPHMSPFNVGRLVQLRDFSLEEVTGLNERHGDPIRSDADLVRLMRTLNGQPYLTQKWLRIMSHEGADFESMMAGASSDDGPFCSHLQRLAVLVKGLGAARTLWEVMSGGACTDRRHFDRLRSEGVLVGPSADRAQIRCGLYETFFKRTLPLPD